MVRKGRESYCFKDDEIQSLLIRKFKAKTRLRLGAFTSLILFLFLFFCGMWVKILNSEISVWLMFRI